MLAEHLTFNPEKKERIIFMRWIDISIDAQNAFKKRLLLLTNAGIYIFRQQASKPCNICPPENLCPSGPKLELKIPYDQFIEIFTFPLA